MPLFCDWSLVGGQGCLISETSHTHSLVAPCAKRTRAHTNTPPHTLRRYVPRVGSRHGTDADEFWLLNRCFVISLLCSKGTVAERAQKSPADGALKSKQKRATRNYGKHFRCKYNQPMATLSPWIYVIQCCNISGTFVSFWKCLYSKYVLFISMLSNKVICDMTV